MREFHVFAFGTACNIPTLFYWVLLAVFVVGLTALIWKKGKKQGLRSSAVLLLVEWVLLIICSTLIFREAKSDRDFHLTPLWSYFDYADNSYLMEMAALNMLNTVLFIPIGFLLGCGFTGITWRRALFFGMALSVTIEVLQLIFKKGLCETDDVIHNVIGCMLGYGIYKLTSLLIMHNS